MKTAMERMIDFLILHPEATFEQRISEAERLRDKHEKDQICTAFAIGKQRKFEATGIQYYNGTFEKE